MSKILFELFVTGVLFGSGPCISSCGPLLVSYVAGSRKGLAGSLIVYTIFSCARIAVYLALSLAIFLFGEFAATNWLGGAYKYIFISGGIFIIAIGIFMVFDKSQEMKICRLFKEKFLEKDNKSVVALGLLAGLLPCAPFLAVLSYVALVSKTWVSSLLYSFSFGVGTFVSPLLLLVMIIGIFPKLNFYHKPWFSKTISLISGLVMIFLGIKLILSAN